MRARYIIGISAFAGLIIFLSCEEPAANELPVLSSLTASADTVEVGGTSTLTAVATDPDNDELTYTWTADDGTITGTGASVTWTAPATVGSYTITCTVDDGNDGTDSATITLVVILAPATSLVSAAVTTGPTVDGVGTDSAWDSAQPFFITAGQSATFYNAFGAVDVALTSVHTTTDLYLRATWTDPSATENVDKNLWAYSSGAWSKSGNEDRLYLMFDGGDNGTEGANCSTMCHTGAMYTTGGGHVDVWHWKAHRTNPLGLSDDKWWDGTGRVSDAKTVGAYSNNITPSGNFPLYAGPISDSHFIIIPSGGTTADLTAFDSTDTNLQSSTYPGYYLNANAAGSRWDVQASGVYSAGVWTVEFKRALDTGNADDVPFAVGSTYEFSMAVTDNSGGSHSGAGVFDLTIE